MEIGRNDPCPCGSGKKSKKCCFGKPEQGKPSEEIGNTFDSLRRVFDDSQFSSLEEAQTFVGSKMVQANRNPVDDFHGLSPDQMSRILYYPFESPHVVTFPEILEVEPSAPIITLFKILVEAIGDKGLKSTAKGNLPRNFCREAALKFWGEEKYGERTRYGEINSEVVFDDLHATRLIAELAGLVRKYKGHFILSSKCRKSIKNNGMKAIYPLLFETYCAEFNWPYRDAYKDIHIIQKSFLFTLYLLSKYGDELYLNSFYEDAFLLAFPQTIEEVEPSTIYSPEKNVSNCYTWRILINFVQFFGLAELVTIKPPNFYNNEYHVKKLPLLDAFVTFYISR